MNITETGRGSTRIAPADTAVVPGRSTPQPAEIRALLDALHPQDTRPARGVAVRSDAGRASQLEQAKALLTKAYPALRAQAREAIRLQLLNSNLHLADIDPDRTWLNCFPGAVSNPRSYNGWSHHQAPLDSISLTDLQLRNFVAVFAGDPASLDANTGIYTEGAPATEFGVHNEVRLLSSDVKRAVRESDFYSLYRDKLQRFYRQHLDALRVVAEANVLDYAQSRRHDMQRTGTQGMSDQAMAMLSEAAGHADASLGTQGTQCYVFDIDGYASRDMSWLLAADGHVVLLMPGDAQPVREYASVAAMRTDLGTMVASPGGRARLAGHFSIYNLRSTMWRWGVQDWLKAIADGNYQDRIAYTPTAVSGALFADQVSRMRDDDLDDLRYLIRTNGEIALQELIQAIGAFNGVMANPLCQSAELGLQLWEAGHASTEQDRDEALAGAWKSAVSLGLGLALEGLVRLGAPTALEGVGSAVRGPSRLADGRIGYVLGPTDPPRLPAAVLEDAVGTATVSAAVEGAVGAEGAEGIAPTVATRNSMGLLERTDIQRLYRAVPVEVADNQPPDYCGFVDSERFAVPAMLDGPVVVTSSTLQGASAYGRKAWPRGYSVYQIDAHGLRAVSLLENVQSNPCGLSAHLGVRETAIDEWQAAGTLIDNVGERALEYDEVHLSNQDLPPSRIVLVIGGAAGSSRSGPASEVGSMDLEVSDSQSSAQSSSQDEGTPV